MFLERLPSDTLVAKDTIERLRSFVDQLGILKKTDTCEEGPPIQIEKDLDTSVEMRVSQEPWDWEEPRPFEYFAEAHETASGRYLFDKGLGIRDFAERKKAYRSHASYITKCCLQAAQVHVQRFRSEHGELSNDWNSAIDVLENEISTDLMLITKSAFFEPLENNDFLACMLEVYEAGGFPCGWRGPLPSEGAAVEDGLIAFYPGQN